mgnify:CR=1 FL=1
MKKKLNEKQIVALFEQASEVFGLEERLAKMIEESGEVIVEILKANRSDDLIPTIKEIIDVNIVSGSLLVHFGIDFRSELYQEKLLKLKRAIDKANAKH